MSREKLIFTMTESREAAALRPRVTLHEYPHRAPIASLEWGPMSVHVDTESLRGLRDEIDGFLASESGKRLARHERGGLPEGWTRREDCLLHESGWAVFRSRGGRPWCVADADGIIVREDLASEAAALEAAIRAIDDQTVDLPAPA